MAAVQPHDDSQEEAAEPKAAPRLDDPRTPPLATAHSRSPARDLLRTGQRAVLTFKEAGLEWVRDRAPREAAALSFYTMLSLSPFLIIAVGIAGLVLGEGATRLQLLDQIEQTAGPQVAQAAAAVLANAARPAASAAALLIGGLLLLFGASGAIRQLKSALNTIWNVEPIPPTGTWRAIVKAAVMYLSHLGLVLLFGSGVLLLLVATSAWGWVAGRLHSWLPAAELVLRALDFAIALLLLTLVFALLFKTLPDARIGWRDLWVGALATSLLFNVGRLAIGLYLSGSATTSAYGVAGSAVALLLWVYYSALIVFFGAEITEIHARRRGRELTAKPGARISRRSLV